jgi:hypothetical protein
MVKNYTALNKEGIDMLDEIVRNSAISDTSLRMLVKKIIITERKAKEKTEKPEFSKLFGHGADDGI